VIIPADKLNNGAVYGYLLIGSPASPEFQLGISWHNDIILGTPNPHMHISGVMGIVEVP